MRPRDEVKRHVSWEALSTYHEASDVLEMRFLAARISGIENDQVPPEPPSACVKAMEISMLQAYCVLIQSWRVFCGISCCNQEFPLPLQLSSPMLYRYPPNSRFLNNEEIQRLLLSFRGEKRLRLSCFARRGPGRLGRAVKPPIPVSPDASYCLSSATTSALLMFSKIDDDHSDETRFVGSLAEMSDCAELVMSDIRNDTDGQLTAWEQLYVRACVRFYFTYFWTRGPSPVEAS